MTGWVVLAWASLIASLIPALMIARNLMLLRRPAESGVDTGRCGRRAVSVLIPARDEAGSIGACLDSVLASACADIDVLVLDDGSSDGTPDIVRAIAGRDARVTLLTAPPLPTGWCGKQHACAVLAECARHELMLFIDADVRLAPDAIARLVASVERDDVSLLSGFPRQLTGSWLERLLIPLIHYVLLGFLPFDGMRRSRWRAFAAGCGQLMMVERNAYRRAGGHAAIRESLHDGVRLPRAFRAAGLRTDLVDATHLATCRMYRDAASVWSGLGKNATEGLASPGAIGPMSVWLSLASFVPPLLLLIGWWQDAPERAIALAAAATALSLGSRLVLAARFAQPVGAVLLHPIGVALLLLIQWQAAIARARGTRTAWKGRSYGPVVTGGDG